VRVLLAAALAVRHDSAPAAYAVAARLSTGQVLGPYAVRGVVEFMLAVGTTVPLAAMALRVV